jgi:dipeptidyl aminopeptidase/acylaminoacyl peptidase
MQAGRDGDPSYSPDGRWVAFHSQAGKPNYFEARHVGLVASGGGRIRYLTEGKDYDVFRGGARFHWSMDGREIFYLAGRSVHDYLYRQNLETGAASVVLESVSGAFSFTPDGKRAVFLQSALYRPAEVFLYEQGKTTQLTRVFDSLGSHPRVQSKAVRWKSRDGLEVEGILWLPFDYKAGTRVPLLTELHGGPTGVILDLFPGSRTYPIQVFLDHGYAVFAPNFRGSVNYGAPFRMKIAQSQGFGDFDDMNTGIDKLIADGIADPDRLGVMGWSYGGYLSAWTIGHTNRFKAASVGAPATDWATYYGQSDGARTVLWTYFGGTPWAKPENYARHSPRAGLANVTTPTLLQVGERDINHNAEIFQALTDLGVPVEYAVYPREGHGIAEPAHQRDLMQRNFDWFERWLKR